MSCSFNPCLRSLLFFCFTASCDGLSSRRFKRRCPSAASGFKERRAEAATVEGNARQELDRYNEALRKARAEIYGEQEAARQVALDGRSKLLKAMRARAQEDVDAAKQRIAAEVETARAAVESQVPSVAGEIVRRMLETPSSPGIGTTR